MVTELIVSQFFHLTPKSLTFQKACGVRYLYSPHILHEYTTIKRLFIMYLIKHVIASDFPSVQNLIYR
jgi:hypothetical protein